MLFAAGLGTRLASITQNLPKALVTVNGKTLLERNIAYLKTYGIDEIVINVHHFSDLIRDFLIKHNNFDIKIHISDESNALLETGGGLVKAKHYFTNEDFVVMNVDILTQLDLQKLILFHRKHQPLVTLAVSERESSRKLMFDATMRLCGWKNFVSGEEIINTSQVYKVLAFSGIHIINSKIFTHISETGKFSIMQSYMRLMSTHTILGFEHYDNFLIDVGKPESIVKAETYYQ